MVPESERHIAFAHYLRGVAAFIVLLHHYLTFLYAQPAAAATVIFTPFVVPQDSLAVQLLMFLQAALEPYALDFRLWGHIGVGVFFLISGFIIPFSLLRAQERGFLLARVIRLWPTYTIGFATIMLVLAWSSYRSGWFFPADFALILQHLLLIQDIMTGHTFDLVSWTLAVEFVFYLFCALTAQALRDGHIIPIVGLAIIAVVVGTVLPFFAWNGQYPILIGVGRYFGMLCYLLIGVLFNMHYRRLLPAAALTALAALLFALFIASRYLVDFGQPRQLYIGLAYIYAFLLFAVTYIMREKMTMLPDWLARPFSFLADISYPLYIIHAIHGYVLINLLCSLGVAPGVAILQATIWSGGVAYGLHSFIEQPTHAWARRVSARYPLSPSRSRLRGGQRSG